MKRDGRIVQERVIGAPVADVYAAWGDAKSLSQWMCPAPDMRPATVEVDFRVGGHFTIVMHGERDYGHTGEFLEIEPERRIVFSWISDFVPPAEARTRVTVELEALGEDETRIRLVHDELPPTDTYDGHDGGWSNILAGLHATLERA